MRLRSVRSAALRSRCWWPLSAAVIAGASTAPLYAQSSRSAPASISQSERAELRACRCTPDETTLRTALALKRAGWIYVMPVPKSRQAAWGNFDRRTTWWPGYWQNVRTNATSETQPYRDERGAWSGDGRGGRSYYRNGGSPSPPTEIEWLCSTEGGIPPRSG